MHYYQHNIKQFNNATMHLTRVERALYRDAIELYYNQEAPLTADFAVLSRRLMARSENEKLALKSILDEFFYLDGIVYRQDRCDEEIESYHSGKSAKARAGRASAEARRRKRDAAKEHNPTPVEHPLNTSSTEGQHNPTNQEPLTNNHKPKPPKSPKGDHMRFDEFYLAYPRKAARAQAVKAWNKLKADDALIDRILEDIPIRIKSGEFDITDKTHIPHPATYLNGRRWEDEITPRGVSHGTNQQTGGNRKLSAVDRVRRHGDELDQQIAEAEAEEAHGPGVDSDGGDLWPSADQPVWGDDAGDVGPPSEGILVN